MTSDTRSAERGRQTRLAGRRAPGRLSPAALAVALLVAGCVTGSAPGSPSARVGHDAAPSESASPSVGMLDPSRTPHDSGGPTGAPERTAGAAVSAGPTFAVPRPTLPTGSPIPALAWAMPPLGDTFENARLGAVAVVDDRVVLSGGVCTSERSDASCRAAVWWSRDGDSWERSEAVEDGDIGGFGEVAAGPGGLVAVGSLHGGGAPAIWWSADGRRWSRAVADAALEVGADGGPTGRGLPEGPAYLQLWGVASGGPGYVAVGTVACYCPLGPRGVRLTSADGRVWRRAPVDPAFDDISLTGVTSGEDAALVAFGSRAVWLSPDGRRWDRHTLIRDGVLVNAVARDRSRWLAIADTGEAAWLSRDARTWRPVPGPGGGVIPSAFVTDAVVLPDAYVAVGRHGTEEEQGVVWTSADGGAWTRTRLPSRRGPDVHPSSVALFRGRVLRVGFERSEDGQSYYPGMWSAPAT